MTDMVDNHARRAVPRQRRTGETLFEFLVGHDHIRCELCNRGARHGTEATFYRNGKLLMSRRFDPRLDPTRAPRELAVQWAQAERRVLEAGSDS
jgi:hypothetical protein